MPEETAKPSAPYLPFKTFLGSFDVFSQGVPPRIDRGIWRTQPGGIQGLIMGAYRFFGLIDESDKPKAALLQMAGDSVARQVLMQDAFATAYAGLLKHDLTKMTMKMLEDEIEQYGVTGQTKRKAITFFLQGAKFADLPLSSFLQAQSRASAPRKRKGGQRGREENGQNGEPEFSTPPAPKGDKHEVQLRNGGKVTIIFDVPLITLHGDDREFVFGLIDSLRTYELKGSVQKSISGGAKS